MKWANGGVRASRTAGVSVFVSCIHIAAYIYIVMDQTTYTSPSPSPPRNVYTIITRAYPPRCVWYFPSRFVPCLPSASMSRPLWSLRKPKLLRMAVATTTRLSSVTDTNCFPANRACSSVRTSASIGFARVLSALRRTRAKYLRKDWPFPAAGSHNLRWISRKDASPSE